MTRPEDRDRALAAYFELQRAQPALFAGRPLRPIVLDRETLERYAAEHGVALGLLGETPYVYLVADLVERPGPDGAPVRFPYTRVIRKDALAGCCGAVAFGVIADAAAGRVGDVVLVRQERHATGRLETELPRGFGKPGETPEDVALRELREETGYRGRRASRLAHLTVDSGMEDGTVWVVRVDVDERAEPRADLREAIDRVLTLSVEELHEAVEQGRVRDALTLAALGVVGRAFAR